MSYRRWTAHRPALHPRVSQPVPWLPVQWIAHAPKSAAALTLCRPAFPARRLRSARRRSTPAPTGKTTSAENAPMDTFARASAVAGLATIAGWARPFVLLSTVLPFCKHPSLTQHPTALPPIVPSNVLEGSVERRAAPVLRIRTPARTTRDGSAMRSVRALCRPMQISAHRPQTARRANSGPGGRSKRPNQQPTEAPQKRPLSDQEIDLLGGLKNRGSRSRPR